MPTNDPMRSVANLPAAHVLLKDYIEDSKSGFSNLNKKQKESVFYVYNQLQILFAQQGWLRQGGKIADYYAKLSKGTKASIPTQQELIDETVTADDFTRKFTIKILWRTIENIQKLLSDESLPDHLRALLDTISPFIENTLINTSGQPSIKCVLKDPMMRLAQELKITFIPFAQDLDPLKETRNVVGHCYGHTMVWSDNVTASPIPSPKLFRANPNSYLYQVNQNQKDVVKTIIFSKNKLIEDQIKELIAAISPYYVYRLSFAYHYGDNNESVRHSMGIRQLPNGDYEFIDSNYGTFVFEKVSQLEQWLSALLLDYSSDNADKMINLRLLKIGQQFSNATAGIPIERKFLLLGSLIDEPDDKRKTILKHNADVFIHNYKLDSRDEKSIQAEQVNLYKYFIRPHGDFSGNEEEGLKRSNERESRKLKSLVIDKIDAEIKRLYSQKKKENRILINALSDLKHDINHASPVQTLSVVINQWLESTPLNSTKIHKDMLPHKTKLFINKLEEQNEISPYYLNLLRARLVEQLRHMFFDRSLENLTAGHKKTPRVVELLLKHFGRFQNGELSFRNFLEDVKGIASKNYAENFLTRYARGQNSEINKLCDYLRKVNPDNADSLSNCFNQMEVFNKKYLVDKSPVQQDVSKPCQQ